MNPYLDKDIPIEITSRNLPHWQQEGKLQFVTFHLADSIPKNSMIELKRKRERWMQDNPKPWTRLQAADYRKLFNEQTDIWLDAGHGSCVLRNIDIAQIVADALEYFDGTRYDLISYVVMPNHVHVLANVYEGITISDICKSWKGYSAKQINQRLGSVGSLWQSESWDRIIRDEYHLRNVLGYIVKNVNNGGVIWKI